MQLHRGRQLPTSPSRPSPLPWFHFWNEWVINQRCLLKPCFDTQPMAFPSEINNYWPAAPHCPSLRPSAPQHLRLHLCLRLCLRLHLCLCLHLFHRNYPSTIQYNWLESETQCALMHPVLNSWRDRLWFNWLKDTETWSWNVMQCFESHTSPLPSPPCTPPSLHHLHLHLCKKKYCIKLIFM